MKTNFHKNASGDDKVAFEKSLSFWDIDAQPPVEPKMAASCDIDAVIRKHRSALKKAFESAGAV
jgi:hypothetical protein